MIVDKELSRLQERATKLVSKFDKKGYEPNDLEIAMISKISKAKSMKDINWLVLNQFDRLRIGWNIS